MGIIFPLGSVFHLMRLYKIHLMQAYQYPHLPAEQFERWKRLELYSIYLFLGAISALGGSMLLVQMSLPPEGTHYTSRPDDPTYMAVVFIGGVVSFLALLVVSAIVGSRAARLRKTLGISINISGSKRERAEAERQNLHAAAVGVPYYATPAPRYPAPAPASPWTGTRIAALVTLIVLALGIQSGLWYMSRFDRTPSNATVVSKRAEQTPDVRQEKAAASGAGSPTSGPVRRSRVEKRVLALYYPWYQTPQSSGKWAHQSGVDAARKRMASHTRYPAQGPYDSHDASVIDRHLRQAEQAGIDTLVCSWWGRSDPTDSALRTLLARAARTNIKICVLWEQPPQAPERRTLDKEFGYLLTTFGRQPAYLRVHDKPVVFLFDRVCRSVPNYRWPTIRDDVETRFAPGAFLIGDGAGTEHTTAWDGQFSLGAGGFVMGGKSVQLCATDQHQDYRDVIQLGRQMQIISVVTLVPGYDDRKPNAASGQPAHAVADRQDGKLYSALWLQAIDDDPDWILVNSFNQWHAGTEIEPSVETGDAYLNLTHRFAAQFKRQSANR